eukprot:1161707-Pleurochrysis_carterae.AAC.2
MVKRDERRWPGQAQSFQTRRRGRGCRATRRRVRRGGRRVRRGRPSSTCVESLRDVVGESDGRRRLDHLRRTTRGRGPACVRARARSERESARECVGRRDCT